MPNLKIITIHLNNSKGFEKTFKSIYPLLSSSNKIHWIIKDGNSDDQELNKIKQQLEKVDSKKYQLIQKPDLGIYDAMNHTIELIDDHDYVIFINSGDQINQEFVRELNDKHLKGADIIFADMLYGEDQKKIDAPEQIDFAFILSKTINHQSLIIKGEWIKKYPFKTQYKIVADWVQLFEILKNNKILIKKLVYPICLYEGGGISEIQKDERKVERINYLKSVYSEWEMEGLLLLSRLRQRKWYNFVLKSLDSPRRGIILTVFAKWIK